VPAEPSVGHDKQVRLDFTELPRMELDQLLGQLVERAQEVMATQGRLRGLLAANQAIVGDLDLSAVLRRIVDAARDLVGARYAALGVIAPEGGLAEFVHAGMPPDAVERIGHLPQGKGLLGALIDDPQPIRLRRITDDVRSSGFPRGHPPMTSFLGVPIRVRDVVFGNLYLSESTKGEFTAEDEELTKALAAAAGVAIENARLFEAARLRQDWLRASAAITRHLLSDEPRNPLQLIIDHVREITDADLVSVVLPIDDEPDGPDGPELHVAAAGGPDADTVRDLRFPADGSLSGRVFATGEPLLVHWQDERQGLPPAAAVDLEIGPMVIVPLLGSAKINGVLSAGRRLGRPGFSPVDLDMIAGFANQASIAIELAEARAEQHRAAMLDDRDRIAADLHDQVIQQLFAAGLSLQSVASTLDRGPAADRILTTIHSIDRAIAQIRTTVFQLNQIPSDAAPGARQRLLDVSSELTAPLGFAPTMRFAGIIDTLPGDLADDLVAVLREALSNIARHAGARTAEVDLAVDRQRVSLTVSDDGVGIGESTRRSGLANLRRRAERHGGTFELKARSPAGTTLSWSVPAP
jgi:signal transduction histidine kinase